MSKDSFIFYQKLMKKEGLTQISLTDADARLMKNKNGMDTAYNVQTGVDSEMHLILDYQATNQGTDHELMLPTAEGIKKEAGNEILHVVTGKGRVLCKRS